LQAFAIKLLRFSIAGGAGVLLGYVALYSLTEFVGVWYIWSSFVAFVLNTGVTFYLQRFWTFKNENNQPFGPKQLIMYSMMTASFVGSNTILLYLIVEYVHFHYMVAQVCLTALFSVVSFVLTPKIFTR
jgi:dolichol-phosphate mannosyltransferase